MRTTPHPTPRAGPCARQSWWPGCRIFGSEQHVLSLCHRCPHVVHRFSGASFSRGAGGGGGAHGGSGTAEDLGRRPAPPALRARVPGPRRRGLVVAGNAPFRWGRRSGRGRRRQTARRRGSRRRSRRWSQRWHHGHPFRWNAHARHPAGGGPKGSGDRSDPGENPLPSRTPHRSRPDRLRRPPPSRLRVARRRHRVAGACKGTAEGFKGRRVG
jgi:hypothetical protein